MTIAEHLTSPALEGTPHGFFTRRGGVSAGAFGTLNCSLNGRDEPAGVQENRRRCASVLGVSATALHGLHQVHGCEVAILGADPWPERARPRADGIVTARRGAALGIVTADCGPVLFADRAAGVIGACHAGWRGAVLGICEATVAAMRRLGAEPGRIVAVLGPCIRQPSYEVGPDLRTAVLDGNAGAERFLAPGRTNGRWQFDLPGYILARLSALGLAEVAEIGIDTLSEPARFFSYRRATLEASRPVGHQLSGIALAG